MLKASRLTIKGAPQVADKKSKGGPSGAKALEGKRVKKKKRILHSVQNDKGVKPPIRQAQGKRKLPRGIRQAHPKGCYLDEAAAQREVDFIQRSEEHTSELQS